MPNTNYAVVYDTTTGLYAGAFGPVDVNEAGDNSKWYPHVQRVAAKPGRALKLFPLGTSFNPKEQKIDVATGDIVPMSDDEKIETDYRKATIKALKAELAAYQSAATIAEKANALAKGMVILAKYTLADKDI